MQAVVLMYEKAAFFVLYGLAEEVGVESGAEGGAECRQVYAFESAQGEHHRVVVAFGNVEGLALEGEISLFHLFYIYKEVGDVPLPAVDVVGMGGGTYAHVRRGVPVAAVMT